jgi:hypothetical protein
LINQNTSIITKLDSLISGQKALKERISKIEKLLQDNDSKDNQVEKTKEFIEVFTCELISKTNIYILQIYANYSNY